MEVSRVPIGTDLLPIVAFLEDEAFCELIAGAELHEHLDQPSRPVLYIGLDAKGRRFYAVADHLNGGGVVFYPPANDVPALTAPVAQTVLAAA